MVNVLVGPLQLVTPSVYNGVTVIVAVIGLVVLLTAVKLGMSPFPLAGRPIDGLSFCHEKVVVPMVLVVVKGMVGTTSFAQKIKWVG